MTPGRTLHRVARAICSVSTCERVLEPAIADLQHDYARASSTSRRLRALVFGYGACWISIAWAVAFDTFAGEERGFAARAGAVFALTVAAAAAVEALIEPVSPAAWRFVVTNVPYVAFRAHDGTATLRMAVPLAMFPAFFVAAARTARVSRATVSRTIALGVMVATIASGWMAPAVERWQARRQRDAFVAATAARFYLPPLEWQPDAKSWRDLVSGAFAPDVHRYPGYPNYVAPEDRDSRKFHRIEIYDRAWWLVCAVAAALAGLYVGRVFRPGHLRPGLKTRPTY